LYTNVHAAVLTIASFWKQPLSINKVDGITNGGMSTQWNAMMDVCGMDKSLNNCAE
jgi:hypothetical protein